MRHKILTVDDSKTVRIIIRKAFRSFDCTVIEASNGAEGLAAAAADKPSLILVDVTMPVMDGVEMVSCLKADPLLSSIPVVMLTAERGAEATQRAFQLGVVDYIPKPFKEEVLIERIRKVIELTPVPASVAVDQLV